MTISLRSEFPGMFPALGWERRKSLRTFLWGAFALLLTVYAPTAAVAQSGSKRVPLCPSSILVHLEQVEGVKDDHVVLPNGTECRWYAAMVPWCREGEVKSPDGDCHQRQ